MKILSILLLAAAAVASVSAQTTPLAFEVASIKPSSSRPTAPGDIVLGCHGTDSHSPGIIIPRDRCVVRNEPLRLVVALAYDIPPSLMYPYDGKVLSGPDWMNSEIYSIDAKADAPSTEAQLKLMLQSLLVERFKLKAHHETREMPVYALVVAKNGLKLQPAPKDRDCGGQVRRDHRYELGSTSLGDQCHGFVPDAGALTGRSVDMSDFAEMLSIWAGRIVVDKTGIPGLFDIKMPRLASANVAPAAALEKNPNAAGIGPPGQPAELRGVANPLPTVFTAVEEIGLKLESTKGPVDVLVIDNIQKPTEN